VFVYFVSRRLPYKYVEDRTWDLQQTNPSGLDFQDLFQGRSSNLIDLLIFDSNL